MLVLALVLALVWVVTSIVLVPGDGQYAIVVKTLLSIMEIGCFFVLNRRALQTEEKQAIAPLESINCLYQP